MNLLCPVDVAQQPEGSLPDIQSADHAVEMLKSLSTRDSDDQPFFLAVGFHKPHIPFKFPEEYLDLYPLDEIDIAPNPYIPKHMPMVAYNPWADIRRRDDILALNLSFPFGPMPWEMQRKIRQHYYASVTYMDAQVGRVLSQLERSGLSHDTMIVLVSDHGWSMGEHGEFAKYENFDVTTRVPLLISLPGVTDNNQTHNNNKKFGFIDVFRDGRKIRNNHIHRSTDLVELVDLFPTLSDLCGLPVPPTCPENSFDVLLCTEGASFAKQIHSAVDRTGLSKDWGKKAVFSQYPRPSLWPQYNSDLPNLADIKIMGYSMRTHRYRYTEWVAFDPSVFKANFSKVYAKELYLHEEDPLEMVNVADDSISLPYTKLIKSLSKRLIAGWRAALPTS